MDDFLPHYGPTYSSVDLSREKTKARKLRDSPWWKKKKQSGICYYCRKKFKPADLTMDHLIPLSRGGRSVKENLVPCCKDCNNKKKYLIPTEWKDYMDKMRSASETKPTQANPAESNLSTDSIQNKIVD